MRFERLADSVEYCLESEAFAVSWLRAETSSFDSPPYCRFLSPHYGSVYLSGTIKTRRMRIARANPFVSLTGGSRLFSACPKSRIEIPEMVRAAFALVGALLSRLHLVLLDTRQRRLRVWTADLCAVEEHHLRRPRISVRRGMA